MEREISPPPSKRRKTAATESTAAPPSANNLNINQAHTNARSIRIFSWNINGIQPFLPSSSAAITSYFKPSGSGAGAVKAGSTVRGRPQHSLRTFMARHGWPEVLFLQELKTSPRDGGSATAALLSVLNTSLSSNDVAAPETTYTLDVCLPRDKFNARGFGGRLYGVGTLLRSDFAETHVSRVRGVEWDLEGRVQIVEMLRGRQCPPRDASARLKPAAEADPNPESGTNRPLALINVYAVNGTTAPYYSPQTGKKTGTRHDHKLAFHMRLRDECLTLERQGFDVVVAGDLNVARGPLDGHPRLRTWPAQHRINRAHFNTTFFGAADNARAGAYVERGDVQPADSYGGGATDSREKEKDEEGTRCLDAVDVFRALHNGERRYTYHPRTVDWGASCDRVDLVLVSRRLWESGRVLATDILDSPQERGPSDHVPLWVKFAF